MLDGSSSWITWEKKRQSENNKMLLPEDPNQRPELFDSVAESMANNTDNLVVLEGHVDELRRSNALGQSELFIKSLRESSASRVCASGGAAIPPFFAITSNGGELRLQSYVARGNNGEGLKDSTLKHDMEILSVVVGMLGESRLKIPRDFSEKILHRHSNNGDLWETWSVDELEKIRK